MGQRTRYEVVEVGAKMPQSNVHLFPVSPPSLLESGSGGPHPPDMSDLTSRVSKVEGAVEGLKGAIDALRWVIGILALVVIGGVSFLGILLVITNNRMVNIESKVDALPEKINSNLQNLTTTLSTTITASKQQAPQVILVQPSTVQSPPTAAGKK